MEFTLYTAALIVRGELIDQFISESKTTLLRQIFLRMIDYFSLEHETIRDLKKLKSIDYLNKNCEEFQENNLLELTDYLQETGIEFNYSISENILGHYDNQVQVIESDIL